MDSLRAHAHSRIRKYLRAYLEREWAARRAGWRRRARARAPRVLAQHDADDRARGADAEQQLRPACAYSLSLLTSTRRFVRFSEPRILRVARSLRYALEYGEQIERLRPQIDERALHDGVRATLTRKLFERRAIPEKRSNIRATIISINEETQRAEGADSAAAGAEVDARPEGSLREIDGDALGAAEPSEKRARSASPPASAMDSSSTSPVTVRPATAPEGGQPETARRRMKWMLHPSRMGKNRPTTRARPRRRRPTPRRRRSASRCRS